MLRKMNGPGAVPPQGPGAVSTRWRPAVFDPNSVFQRCRNPRCKAQLKDPVENPRNAFCCAGCEAGFYRTHCRVCEQPIQTKNSRKELCGRRQCRNQFRSFRVRFLSTWYLGAIGASKPEKSSTKSTAKTTIKSDRAWVQVAGPRLSEVGLRLTDYDREVLRNNFQVNAEFWNAVALIKAHHSPVNILGGFKFANAPAVDRGLLAEITSTELGESESAKTEMTPQDQARLADLRAQIPDDLSIPAFLRRTP